MRIPNGKIENMVSDGTGRLVLSELRLERDSAAMGRLIASDGKALAIVPVDLDADDAAGPVSVDVMKHARKDVPKRFRDHTSAVRLNGNAKIMSKDGTIEMPRTAIDPPNSYPNLDTVIPKQDTLPYTLAIDAEVLFRLADALRGEFDFGAHIVTLKFKLNEKGVVDSAILATNGTDATGVIMPCTPQKKS